MEEKGDIPARSIPSKATIYTLLGIAKRHTSHHAVKPGVLVGITDDKRRLNSERKPSSCGSKGGFERGCILNLLRATQYLGRFQTTIAPLDGISGHGEDIIMLHLGLRPRSKGADIDEVESITQALTKSFFVK